MFAGVAVSYLGAAAAFAASSNSLLRSANARSSSRAHDASGYQNA